MIRGSGVSLVGLLLTGASLGAQTTQRPTGQELERAFEAVVEAEIAASRAHMDADLAHREADDEQPDVSIGTAGLFRVIATTARLAEAEDAVRSAWNTFSPYVDDPGRVLLKTAILLQWADDDPIDAAQVGREFEPWRMNVLRNVFGYRDPATVVRGQFADALGRSTGLRGLSRLPEGWVYRLLMLSPTVVVGECLAGDSSACWGAMGIGSAEPEWKAWVRPSEYAEIVSRIAIDVVPERLRGARDRCITSGNDLTCESFFAELPPQLFEPFVRVPLGEEVIADLARFALEAGGKGSFERLLPGPGRDLQSRLGSAALMGTDDLVLAWVDDVVGRGVDRGRDSRRRRSSALLWYVLFMIPAARSTRWRLS